MNGATKNYSGLGIRFRDGLSYHARMPEKSRKQERQNWIWNLIWNDPSVSERIRIYFK